MTGGSLRWAGWLAMASAVLSLPMFLFSLQNQGNTAPLFKIVDAVMQVAGTALFVMLTLLLRRFLGRRFNFHDADRIIDLMIITNLIVAVISLVTTFLPSLQQAAAQVILIVVLVMGILQLRFGYVLLALPDDLGGLRRPYAYLTMATGICLASIILVPVAVVLSAVADVMLGTIFLQACRSIKTTA